MDIKRPKLSLCLPVYEMKGQGLFFLEQSLKALSTQTFRDFDVVITDNSENDLIESFCKAFNEDHFIESNPDWVLDIKYFRNPPGIKKGISQNTNEAIRHATGELIKILYQDDRLAHDNVLQEIIEAFKGGWLITGTDNNFYPYWTDDIETGNNKLGSPSALTMENYKPLYFNETLEWLLDVEYYKRIYDRYGAPTILAGEYVIMGIGPHQLTEQIPNEVKTNEYFILNKHD